MNANEGPQKITAKDGHEYHKSATANATVAPTNEHTLANAAKTKGLKPEEQEFVTLIHYEFGLTGKIEVSRIAGEYGYSKEEFSNLFKREAVQRALTERGIPRRLLQINEEGSPVGNQAKQAKLTPVQLIVANTMLDLADTRSTKKKLQDLGCTTATYQMWLRDEHFSSYLRERAESLVGDIQHEAMLALVDRVSSGDLKAIQYYHELTGRYVQQSSSNQSSSSHDLQSMIVRIIEIIIDEVDDPQTALRISDRLKGLVTGAQVAGILPSIETPEVVTREVTPEIQELMNRGVGYDA